MASLRSHSGTGVLDLKDPGSSFDFHNLIIAPSFTPWYKNNPAVSGFSIDDRTLVPKGFRSTYWNLKPTIGHPHIMSYPELQFRDLDYATDFGIDELTAESIQDFAQKLIEDPKLQKDYMVRKVGLDPTDPEEVLTALEIFKNKGLVTLTSTEPP